MQTSLTRQAVRISENLMDQQQLHTDISTNTETTYHELNQWKILGYKMTKKSNVENLTDSIFSGSMYNIMIPMKQKVCAG